MTRGRRARQPFLAPPEQERLGRLRAQRCAPRNPLVVRLIHVRVICDVTAERTVEIPKPIRPERVPTRSPERLIAGLDETSACEHEFGRAAEVESKMLAALHVGRSLNKEEGVVVQ